MIPLFHDLDEETVLVFGGGGVGTRKARRFADEARVIVVSPRFDDDLGDLSSTHGVSVELVRAAPGRDDVRRWIERADPALVVAATDDATINAAIEGAALDAGLLVNRTDRSGTRDPRSVVVPATVTDDPVRVAVSTGARSPALARVLRERIESAIDGAGPMADLSGTLREELRERELDPDERREAIRAVVRSDGVWKALQEGGSKGRQEAENVIQEVLDR